MFHLFMSTLPTCPSTDPPSLCSTHELFGGGNTRSLVKLGIRSQRKLNMNQWKYIMPRTAGSSLTGPVVSWPFIQFVYDMLRGIHMTFIQFVYDM